MILGESVTILLDKNNVLLATQIKYDVTEIAICPQLWYEMRLTDYAKTKHNIIKSNNQIVSELKLKEEFKIIEQ